MNKALLILGLLLFISCRRLPIIYPPDELYHKPPIEVVSLFYSQYRLPGVLHSSFGICLTTNDLRRGDKLVVQGTHKPILIILGTGSDSDEQGKFNYQVMLYQASPVTVPGL